MIERELIVKQFSDQIGLSKTLYNLNILSYFVNSDRCILCGFYKATAVIISTRHDIELHVLLIQPRIIKTTIVFKYYLI